MSRNGVHLQKNPDRSSKEHTGHQRERQIRKLQAVHQEVSIWLVTSEATKCMIMFKCKSVWLGKHTVKNNNNKVSD